MLLASAADGKVQLAAGLTPDLIARGLHAGQWLKEVAPIVGGGGGGRPDLAQAGGKNPEQIPAALARRPGVPPGEAPGLKSAAVPRARRSHSSRWNWVDAGPASVKIVVSPQERALAANMTSVEVAQVHEVLSGEGG